MSRIRVGVIRGGPSSEYDVSLKTGGSILRHIPEEKYEAHDILITKDGTWHWRGVPVAPEKLARHFDVVWNALHGEYGEDGQIQQLLESLGIPYTGSTAYASAVGMNKALAKEYFKALGLKTPAGELFFRDETSPEDAARTVFSRISPPWIVKPAALGSSVGATLARTFDGLVAGIKKAFAVSPKILAEECIRGREATCGVVDNFRGKEYYSLLPVEIFKPANKEFFDYECKYDGSTRELCPGNFTRGESEAIQEAALAAHRGLGLRHYSRADFIVSPRGLYILEVNTLPGMTSESLLPKSLAAVGCEYPQFLDHVLTLALQK
jgi:D-alanine-D-alanine ligase